jgi:hypothetical protein
LCSRSVPGSKRSPLGRETTIQCFCRTSMTDDRIEIDAIPDASVISDERGRGEHASVIGAFVGI